MTIFDKDFVFEFFGQKFEYLDPEQSPDHQFRIILGEDDYDYVEDKWLIERLCNYIEEMFSDLIYGSDVSLSFVVGELESELRNRVGDDSEYVNIQVNLIKRIKSHI